jgi:hypothetical protein
MIKVFVCSPYTFDPEKNIEKAIQYSRYVYKRNKLPITPHIYFTRFLNDSVKEERAAGINMGLELMDWCDMMWVFGKNITTGMQIEIDYWANTKKTPITYIKRIE